MLYATRHIKPPTFWTLLRSRLFKHEADAPRYFSEMDYYRFQGLLTKQHTQSYTTLRPYLLQLRHLLEQGCLYPCKAVPPSLVTMNCVVLLRSRRGTAFRVSLVYPPQENRKQRRISVLSPLGLALIGRAAGQSLSDNLKIEAILSQPERQGQYYT